MKFEREKSRNYFLNDTPIPNVFLGEYMLRMPGDFVRVYLYTYMRTMAGDAPGTEESIARDLGLKVEDVLSAWMYLEQKRLIRRKTPKAKDGYYTIEFVDLKGGLFVGQRPSDIVNSDSATVLEEESVRKMFLRIEKAIGRPLSDKDYKNVSDFLIAYNTGADVVAFTFESAVAQKGPFHLRTVKNMLTILDRAGVQTEEEAEICLAEYNTRDGWHMEIKKALGIPNNLTEEEKRIFDQWFDEYRLTIEDILHKAKQTAGKNNKFAYLKSILDNDAEKSGIVITEQNGKPSRKKFYEMRRKKAEAAAEKKRKELYAALPEIRELDEDIRRLSMELSLTKVSGADNRKTVMRDISKTLSARADQRNKVLTSAGFDVNYTDVQYACPLCNDTGVLENGTTCSCFEF